MTENSRRDRVGLGLIGLGPSWEEIYRETLVRLQSRLKVRLVYDPVEGRARSVASELGAEVAGSLRQILFRHSLQGLLVLDPGWCGSGILTLVARSGKPVYLASPVLRNDSALRTALHGPTKNSHFHPATADDRLMPELGLRFTPASCRLRELIATKLGVARNILVDCDLRGSLEETALLVDWCNHIMGCMPVIPAQATRDVSLLTRIELKFPASHSSVPSSPLKTRTAQLRQRSATSTSMRIEIECEHGNATLANRTHLIWSTSSHSADESLADERTEFDILIDQFCRRALGGLNPVGRLSELVTAMDVVKSIW